MGKDSEHPEDLSLRDRLEQRLIDLVDACLLLRPIQPLSATLARAVKIVAHRGDHACDGILENTFAAFERAAQAGCWGLEFDLRWTSDLVPVIHHDEDLWRVFRVKKKIRDMTASQLRLAAPAVPTLQEMIERFGRRCHLMIEIKEQNGSQCSRQAHILQETLSPLTPLADYHFLSFEPFLFTNMKIFEPALFFPIARWNPYAISRLALREGFGGFMSYHGLLPKSVIEAHARAGQIVATGFIDSLPLAAREMNRGIPWLFSDEAVAVQQLLNGLVNSSLAQDR